MKIIKSRKELIMKTKKENKMQKKTGRLVLTMLALVALVSAGVTGCSKAAAQNPQTGDTQQISTEAETRTDSSSGDFSGVESKAEGSGQEESAGELSVQFGDNGEAFTLHLYDNDTARAIARHVGTAEWRLPIYHYDDYEGCEYMQYYDIPSRYEIPSLPETVTSVKAGEVYYSDPNRIVLFYQDAEIQGEYSRVGYFDASEAFVSAVENNPVLQGWGNKIVVIR